MSGGDEPRRLAALASRGLLAGLASCAGSTSAQSSLEPVAEVQISAPPPAASTAYRQALPPPVAASASAPVEKACCRDVHDCRGKNQCKGLGGCQVGSQSACKGQNSCKGLGGCKTSCD